MTVLGNLNRLGFHSAPPMVVHRLKSTPSKVVHRPKSYTAHGRTPPQVMGFLFYHILMLKYGNNFEKHYHMAYYHIFGYLKKLPYLRLPYLRKLSEISPYTITIFVIW